MSVEVSDSSLRYLSAILLLSRDRDRPAKTGEIADRLDVNPATVTERLVDFDERDLVDYERYEGATLTNDGELLTRERMWKRCLAENFTRDELGLPEADSESIGQALSDEAADALKELIDHPCNGRCSAPEADFDACCPDYQEP
jgi:DtxR family Mn-dependent transcriptional regulator